MKMSDVKVGMRVVWEGNEHFGRCSGYVMEEKCPYEGGIWVMWDSDKAQAWILASSVEPEALALPAQFKINVQKYADDNGLTLEQAHNEIQPWLFEQGCKWGFSGEKTSCTDTVGLFYSRDWSLSHCCSGGHKYFYENKYTEIFLQRKASVEISLLPLLTEEPLVELNGKKYRKQDLEAALSKLVAVEE